MTLFGPGSLFKSPLGTKAYLLFVGVFLLALFPFGLAVFTAISYFGQYSIDVNEEQIRKQADKYMELAIREQAQHHELFFPGPYSPHPFSPREPKIFITILNTIRIWLPRRWSSL